MTASFFYKYLIWFVYCIAIHQKLKKSWSSSIVNWWCYSLQHSIVYILPKFPGYIKSEINTEFTRQCALRPRGTNKKYGHCHNCNFHWFSFNALWQSCETSWAAELHYNIRYSQTVREGFAMYIFHGEIKIPFCLFLDEKFNL